MQEKWKAKIQMATYRLRPITLDDALKWALDIKALKGRERLLSASEIEGIRQAFAMLEEAMEDWKSARDFEEDVIAWERVAEMKRHLHARIYCREYRPTSRSGAFVRRKI